MDEKAVFDALLALSDQAWRDWDHKTRHEWRFSFALWAALLGASAAILKLERSFNLQVGTLIAFIVVVAFLTHICFLCWIHGRQKDFRDEYLWLRARMLDVVKLKDIPSEPCCCKCCVSNRSPAFWTQVVITFLLSGLLFLIVAHYSC